MERSPRQASAKRSKRPLNESTSNPPHPLANIPEKNWPENSKPDFGLRFRSEDAKERFKILLQRKLVPSRFLDEGTLIKLGILQEVMRLTRRLHLWEFLSSPVQTFRTLTYEFLATLVCEDDYSECTFQLDGQTRTLTVQTLNLILKTNHHARGTFIDWPSNMPQEDFEEKIMGRQRDGHRASQIQHPVLRCIQRALGYTIFGRGETSSTLNKYDLYFLACMLNTNPPGQIDDPNVGHFVLRHLERVAGGTRAGGNISVGGIITLIARYFDVIRGDPAYRTIVEGPSRIDIASLTAMRLIKREEGEYFTLGHNGEKAMFPLQIKLSAYDPSTWLVHGPEEPDETPTEQPQQTPPPTPAGPSSRAQPMSEPTNAMIYEKLCQLHNDYNRMQEYNETQDQLLYETWHLTQRMHNWHLARNDYEEEDIPPRPTRRRNHRQQPPGASD